MSSFCERHVFLMNDEEDVYYIEITKPPSEKRGLKRKTEFDCFLFIILQGFHF